MKKALSAFTLILLAIVSLAYAGDIFNSSNMLYIGTHKIRAFAGSATTSADGYPPIIYAIGTATTTVATTTRNDITGTTINLVANSFSSNERIEWTVEGSLTGTNSTKNFEIYILDAPVATTTVASGKTGDFILNCSVTSVTSSTQNTGCILLFNATTSTMSFARITDKDMASGGIIKLQIMLDSSSDEVVASTTKVLFLNY